MQTSKNVILFSISTCSGAMSNSEAVQDAKRKRKRTGVLNIKVAIVGGGIGGLSCALALQKAGIDYTVYEKDMNFEDRMQGYGLTLTNNDKGPLAQLGLLETCIAKDCPSEWHWVFDRSGNVLGYYGKDFKTDAHEVNKTIIPYQGERGNLRIPRQDLRKMLLDSIDQNRIKWGSGIRDYTEHDDGLSIELESGDTVDADVLVGADGIRSKVRQLRDSKILGQHSSDPKYLGVSVILGLSTARHPLIDRGGFYMIDGQHRLFTMPFRVNEEESITMWQLSFAGLTEDQAHLLRSKHKEELRLDAIRRTHDCFNPIRQLIDETPAKEIWATGLYDRDPMPSLSKDKGTRVTVVGDAAHPMSMFKGQGANQAIGDGPLLAQWLSKPGDIRTRIRCFERQMMDRSGPKVLASREAALELHQTSALDRDFGISGIKDKVIVDKCLKSLRDKKITATLGSDLLDRVRQVIKDEVSEVEKM